jgi:hypothetical protein
LKQKLHFEKITLWQASGLSLNLTGCTIIKQQKEKVQVSVLKVLQFTKIVVIVIEDSTMAFNQLI